MCRTCWIAFTALLLVTGGLAYKFVIVGETIVATDGRTEILVSEAERMLLLTEMRAFLVATQLIIQANHDGDMAEVAKVAKKVGRPARNTVPASLIGKLPLSFKRLGFDTHTQFDQIALDAEQFGDPDLVMEQLGTLLNNCVGCHAAYRLALEPSQG